MKINRRQLRKLIMEEAENNSKFSPKGTVGKVEVTVDIKSQQSVTFTAPKGEEYDQSPNFDLHIKFINGEEPIQLINNLALMDTPGKGTEEYGNVLDDRANPPPGSSSRDFTPEGSPLRKPVELSSNQNFRLRGGADDSWQQFQHAEDEYFAKGGTSSGDNMPDENYPVVFRAGNKNKMDISWLDQTLHNNKLDPIDDEGGKRVFRLKAATQGQKFDIVFTDEFKDGLEFARDRFGSPTSTSVNSQLDESLSRGSRYRRRYRRY